MKNRKILLVVSLVLALAMTLTGTLAYLTDTDSEVNVMTLGNVDIEQHEMKRADGIANDAVLEEGNLVPFVDGIKLYPAYAADPAAYNASASAIKWGPYVSAEDAEDYLFDDAKLVGAVDKIVTVENKGASDAYVRTLLAIEMPDGMDDKIKILRHDDADDIVWAELGKIELDGTTYMVWSATYQQPLAAGETSVPSLLQVALSHEANNEDVAKLGETFEILALTQAVQVQNLESLAREKALNVAFNGGEDAIAPATLVQWFSKTEGLPVTVVTDADELAAALDKGGTVLITEDVTVSETMKIDTDTSVDLVLADADLSYAVTESGASAIINNAGELTISGNGKLTYVAENPDLSSIPAYATNTISNTGTLTIETGVTVENGSDGGASYAVDNHGVFYLNGGTLTAKRCALRVAKYNKDNVLFEMNGGLVEGATPAWIQLPGSNASDAPHITVIINDGTFQTTKASSYENDILYTYSYGNSHANTSLTINGGEFLGGVVSVGSGYKGDVATVTVNGGTFEYDVLQWLADGGTNVLHQADK